MSFIRCTALVGMFVAATVVTAHAQASATQTVTYAVNSIDQVSVTGAPSLTIVAPAAGSAPADVTDATGRYALTTNGTNRKITASLGTGLEMPTGLTLKVALSAPSVGTSAGSVALIATAVDLVTGISNLDQSNLTMTYTLSATSAAVTQTGTRTVTYTILAAA